MLRRVIKPQPNELWSSVEVGSFNPTMVDKQGMEYPGDKVYGIYSDDGEYGSVCPYQVGQRLWCRETWYDDFAFTRASDVREPDSYIYYRADGEAHEQFESLEEEFKWRPSQQMPRWTSRITLEVVGVGFERIDGKWQWLLGVKKVEEDK